MGDVLEIRCKECGYSRLFMLGVGMLYSPHNILDFTTDNPFINNLIKSKKEVARIKKLVEEKNATLENDYGRDVYICENCGEMYDRFYMKLIYDGGSYIPQYKCWKCKKDLRLLDRFANMDYVPWDENYADKISCPRCGKYELKEGLNIVLWD